MSPRTSEDGRMSRGGREPSTSGPSGAARWSDYLDWVRDDMAGAVLALSPEQQRTSLVPSGWTPIELLSHVLHMERRWFVWGFLGEPVAEPWGDWDVPDPSLAESPRWQVPHDVTAEDLVARLEQVGARTRDLLASYPMDTVGAAGGRFAADPPTLEWICFHVLAEYARHAGHLDIVVEIAD